MNLVDLVTLLALVQLFFFSVLVGRSRGQYGVKAPAVSGHEMFERVYRVQMNTMELLVLLLPSLYIAARYWSTAFVAACGVVYLIGRFVYWRAYVSAPERRGAGFLLSLAPIGTLMVAGLVGAVRGMLV